ncbi:hypothetical protein E2C01_061811 [Portunus trituberculatus]|uniref:Uncharacterized protein n=1 Tax=Portunus trituberculatus TaxID=210409 RepID=A0A5B7HGC7_PORTR|nr:hypothetical protein [Portunus trituberculatus]
MNIEARHGTEGAKNSYKRTKIGENKLKSKETKDGGDAAVDERTQENRTSGERHVEGGSGDA